MGRGQYYKPGKVLGTSPSTVRLQEGARDPPPSTHKSSPRAPGGYSGDPVNGGLPGCPGKTCLGQDTPGSRGWPPGKPRSREGYVMHDVSRFWFGQECPDKRCHLASSVCGGGDSSVKRQKTGATWRMMGLSLPPDARDGMTSFRRRPARGCHARSLKIRARCHCGIPLFL